MPNIDEKIKKYLTRLLIPAAVVMTGCATQTAGTAALPESSTPPVAETSQPADKGAVTEAIKAGDLVTVDFTMTLESGEVFYTTRKALADDPKVVKTDWFRAPDTYGPEQVLAGNDNGRQELAVHLVGMAVGGQKRVTLPQEKGFGAQDAQKVLQFERVRTIPRKAYVKAANYVKKFGRFPVKGQKVRDVPYFQSLIKEVTDKYVLLEALAEDGQQYEADYGVTTIQTTPEKVVLSLDPRIGAPFVMKKSKGVIVEKDEKSFFVDFNHPAAGQPIVLDFQVLSVEKVNDFMGATLNWIEDHDKGYAAAAEQDKPMVMVLYADWCSWCKKLMGTTVKDPRIQKMWDSFVWAKVNSDKEKAYKAQYRQDGFPMIILTNPKGDVVNSLNGYRDARTLMQELEKILSLAEKKNGQG